MAISYEGGGGGGGKKKNTITATARSKTTAPRNPYSPAGMGGSGKPGEDPKWLQDAIAWLKKLNTATPAAIMPNRPKQPTTLAEVEHPRNTQPVGMGGAPTANLPVVPQAYIPAWARQSLLASQTPAWGYGGLPQKETVGFGDLRAVERAQIPGYSQPGMGGAPTANLPLFYQAPYGSPANPYVPPPRRPVGMGDLRRAEFEQAAAERSRQPQYGMGDLRRMEYLIGQYLAGSQPQASRPASGAGAGSGTTAPRRASGGGGRGGGSAPTFGPQYSRDFTQPVPRWVQAMTVWRI